MKILQFLLFLIAYAWWAFACAWSLNKLQTTVPAGKSFWTGQLVNLEGLIGFFGFIYLLSGFWSWRLVLLIFLASQLGVLSLWVLGLVMDVSYETASIRTLWAGKEFDLNHPVLSPALVLVSGAMAWALPVAAGIVFFHHAWDSSALQIPIVKCMLLLLMLPGYIMQLTVVASMLASENLDDDVRQRIFINQGLGMIPMAIYVALAFWAFGIGKPLDISFLGVPGGALSLETLLPLLALFAVTLLIPFLVGTLRTRKRNLLLLRQIRGYFGDLEDILSSPTPSIYLDEIGKLRGRVEAVREQFTTTDPLLIFDKEAMQSPEKIPDKDKLIAAGIEKTRDLDARFKFLDNLGNLETELDKVVAEFQKRAPETLEEAARHWSDKFKIRCDDLNKAIDGSASSKPFLLAGAGTLVSALVLDLVSEVAKTAWDWIAHVPK